MRAEGDEHVRQIPAGAHADSIRRAEERLAHRPARAERRERAFGQRKRVGTAELALLGPQSSVCHSHLDLSAYFICVAVLGLHEKFLIPC